MLVWAALAVASWGCGGDEGEGAPPASPPERPSTEPPPRERPPPPQRDGARNRPDRPDGGGRAERGASPERPGPSAAERAVSRAVRGYVRALDRRDGQSACELLAPDALSQLDLPRSRGGCAASLEASIGYRDPRGLPAFQSARLLDLPSIEVEGDQARATATIVTEFADRDEPSVEDDIVYLQRAAGDGAGAGWLVVKPSSVLYRAVGIADIPPDVIAPPG